MKIILDAMGGDFAPEAPVLGAIEAAKAYGTQITLVGRGEEILEVLKKNQIENLPAGIEKQDYDGSINILMPDWSLYLKCFDPGDDMTDVLNKALYNREIKVEEYLGVDITYEHIPEGINYYYDKIVYRTDEGECRACYCDDFDNNWCI